ncbi:hypothetical protein R4575_16965 [Acinetobacter baumannii]|nr:hypothetical protein [Acinetobacter baumannii]
MNDLSQPVAQNNSAVSNENSSHESEKKNHDSHAVNSEKSVGKDDQNDPTKNMTKAEKKVYELKQKILLAEQALEKEKELEREKNKQEVIKFLEKKKLFDIPLSQWKKSIDEISEFLK